MTSFSYFSQQYDFLGGKYLNNKIMLVKFSIKMVLFEIYSGVFANVLWTYYSGMMDRYFLATRRHLTLNIMLY